VAISCHTRTTHLWISYGPSSRPPSHPRKIPQPGPHQTQPSSSLSSIPSYFFNSQSLIHIRSIPRPPNPALSATTPATCFQERRFRRSETSTARSAGQFSTRSADRCFETARLGINSVQSGWEEKRRAKKSAQELDGTKCRTRWGRCAERDWNVVS